MDFPELQGFLRCGTFSAETRRDLDKLGPAGHPRTRRKRQKKFPAFSLPLSSLSPASTSHGLDRVGSHFGKYLAGVRLPAGQSKAGSQKARNGLEGHQAQDWYSHVTGGETSGNEGNKPLQFGSLSSPDLQGWAWADKN